MSCNVVHRSCLTQRHSLDTVPSTNYPMTLPASLLSGVLMMGAVFMDCFAKNATGGVALWRGHPDSQAAHDSILAWLTSRFSASYFFSSVPPVSVHNILKGNLGECIALCVGTWNDFYSFHSFPINAHDPLRTKSRDGVDIVWILFGPCASWPGRPRP